MKEITNKKEARAALCDHVYAMSRQAPHDFGGEQREFYIPRLHECLVALAVLFPEDMAIAMAIGEGQ